MGCEFPRVTTFLFCGSLRTGALTIGYFSMMMAALIGFLFALVMYLLMSTIQDSNNPFRGLFLTGISQMVIIVCSFIILILVLFFVINLLMVIGARKRRPSYMKCYLIACILYLVLSIMFVYMKFTARDDSEGKNYTDLVTLLVGGVMMCYFFVVVRSAYLEMEEQLANPVHYMHPQRPPPPYAYRCADGIIQTDDNIAIAILPAK